MAEDNNVAKLVEWRKNSFNKCMHVDFSCNNDAIRAHSIQNSKVLDLLQENNHVIMPQPKVSAKEPIIEFASVGRNNASTFTGLCAKHDAELFKLADTEPLDVTNQQQLEQYAYRAVMREMHACLEAGYRFQLAHQDNIKNGVTKANEPDGPGLAAVAFWEKAWRVFRYRVRHFDDAISKREAPALEHHVIELTDQAPTIAASSLFSVTHDEAGDIMGPTLNIVPVNTAKTVAILSYPKEQADAVKMALPELFQADGDKKAGLSKVILQRVENFTISPKFYNAWSEEKRKQVLGAFTNSIMEPKDIPDDIDVSLF